MPERFPPEVKHPPPERVFRLARESVFSSLGTCGYDLYVHDYLIEISLEAHRSWRSWMSAGFLTLHRPYLHSNMRYAYPQITLWGPQHLDDWAEPFTPVADKLDGLHDLNPLTLEIIQADLLENVPAFTLGWHSLVERCEAKPLVTFKDVR